MLNQAIEVHDSKIAGLSYEENGRAVLVFSSLYIHESAGRPGVDPGKGWFQKAVMVIENSITNDHACAWPCQIFGGKIVFDDAGYENVIPLLLSSTKSFKLTLNVIDNDDEQRQIEISGTGAQLSLVGNVGRIETFPGTDQN